MSKYETTSTKYFVAKETESGVEEVLQFNDFNGSVYWYSDANSATKYDSKEQAEQMRQLQEMLGKFSNQKATYKVFVTNSETKEAVEVQGDTAE